jgi:hypothetical protein
MWCWLDVWLVSLHRTRLIKASWAAVFGAVRVHVSENIDDHESALSNFSLTVVARQTLHNAEYSADTVCESGRYSMLSSP